MVQVVNVKYAASATIACTLASLASSSTFVAGRASAAVTNASNLYIDVLLAGQITVGLTITINTQIQVLILGALNDTPTWPDTFGGADANVTLTSVGVGQGFLKRVAALNVDSTTTSRAYPFGPTGVASLFGAAGLPIQWETFVTHNTGSNLSATGANHFLTYIGVTDTIT